MDCEDIERHLYALIYDMVFQALKRQKSSYSDAKLREITKDYYDEFNPTLDRNIDSFAEDLLEIVVQAEKDGVDKKKLNKLVRVHFTKYYLP